MVEKVGKATTTLITSTDMMADVGKDVVEEAESLIGLNMQFKRVYGNVCMIMERSNIENYFKHSA
jgi:hypothetical protein